MGSILFYKRKCVKRMFCFCLETSCAWSYLWSLNFYSVLNLFVVVVDDVDENLCDWVLLLRVIQCKLSVLTVVSGCESDVDSSVDVVISCSSWRPQMSHLGCLNVLKLQNKQFEVFFFHLLSQVLLREFAPICKCLS